MYCLRIGIKCVLLLVPFIFALEDFFVL